MNYTKYKMAQADTTHMYHFTTAQYNTTTMIADSVSYNVSDPYSEGDNYTHLQPPPHYGHVDIDYADRAQRFLTQPVILIALIAGIIVIISNILSLIVLAHVRNPLTSQFLLISSLACSDIIVGVSVLLHLTHKVLSPSVNPGRGDWGLRAKAWCGFVIIKALNTTAVNAALLNLMGMAIDHYVAIIQPLMHSVYMSRRRCTIMIIVFWFIAILCGFSDFLSVLGEVGDWQKYRHKFNYCEFIFLGVYQEEYTLFAIALACLFTMLFIYVRIYWEVRYHTANWPPQQELQRSKKALITTLLILGTFIVCVMPNCVFQIATIITVKYNPAALQRNEAALRQVDKYLYDLVLLNSICNPLIYAFRIREVRHGYVKLLRCCLRRFVKESWLAVSEPNSAYNSATCDEQRKLSRTLSIPTDKDVTTNNSQPQHVNGRGSRASLLWPWQKETIV